MLRIIPVTGYRQWLNRERFLPMFLVALLFIWVMPSIVYHVQHPPKRYGPYPQTVSEKCESRGGVMIPGYSETNYQERFICVRLEHL